MDVIYILKLEHSKIYVGKTGNVHERIIQHIKGQGSEWTKIHKPLIPLQYKVKGVQTLVDEDATTEEYMLKYSIENVRGGSYSEIILPKSSLETLEKKMRTFNNQCYNCGGKHLMSNCSLPKKDYSSLNEVNNKLHDGNIYENGGKKWDDEESDNLINEVNSFKEDEITIDFILQLSDSHKRSPGAILSKLRSCKIIDMDIYCILYEKITGVKWSPKKIIYR